MAIKVGINGFGRIGRLVYRQGVREGGFEFTAINDLVPADNLAYLLSYDSTHGRFEHVVTADADGFSCCGSSTKCVSIKDPAELPWGELGVDYILESTGLFTDHQGASKHLTAGAKRVVISAPTKTPDQVPTLAYKVNHETYDYFQRIMHNQLSCAGSKGY